MWAQPLIYATTPWKQESFGLEYMHSTRSSASAGDDELAGEDDRAREVLLLY